MRERILTALDAPRGWGSSAEHIAKATGVPDAERILLELAATGFADFTPELGGWRLTPAGVEAQPYSGIWVSGELWERHDKDGMSTMSVALADALRGPF